MRRTRTLRLAQSSTHEGGDRWSWSVWLEGSKAQLNDIEWVEYTLHPTFANPVRRVRARASKFRLDASGWGEFRLHAKARRKDGKEVQLQHWLSFREKPSIRKTARQRPTPPTRPAVYITGSLTDRPFVTGLARALAARDVEVRKVDDVEPGQPWEVSLRTALRGADVMAVVISDMPSEWTTMEAKFGKALGVRTVPVLLGPKAKLPASLSDVDAIRLKDAGELEAAVGRILESTKASS